MTKIQVELPPKQPLKWASDYEKQDCSNLESTCCDLPENCRIEITARDRKVLVALYDPDGDQRLFSHSKGRRPLEESILIAVKYAKELEMEDFTRLVGLHGLSPGKSVT